MSFHLDANMPLLRALVASAVFTDLNDLKLPQWEEFEHFQPNQTPQLDYVLQLLKPYKVAPAESVAAGLGQYSSGKVLRKLQIERAKRESKVEEDCKFFANHLLSQWPCLEPTVSGLDHSLLIDIGPALEAIRPEWRRLFMNRDLAEHLQEVQAILDRRTLDDRYEPPPVPSSEEAYTVRIRGGELVDLRQLLSKPYRILKVATEAKPAPAECRGSTDRPFLSVNDFSQRFGNFAWKSNRGAGTGSGANLRGSGITKTGAELFPTGRQVTESAARLRTIAQRLGSSKSAVRRRYADDFQQSLNAFERLDTSQRFNGVMQTQSAAISLSSKKVEEEFYAISSALNVPSQVCSQRRIFWLKAGNLWPIVTKSTLLSCLGSVASQGSHFGSGMKRALLNMGVSITKYQREVRLHDLALKKISGRYHEEDSNEGHSNWSPEEHPDWLLLEIESDMMIRPVQIDVALATISPESGSNSVLQMNMGQGK
jgi:AraC-like DNA-binding protein